MSHKTFDSFSYIYLRRIYHTSLYEYVCTKKYKAVKLCNIALRYYKIFIDIHSGNKHFTSFEDFKSMTMSLYNELNNKES